MARKQAKRRKTKKRKSFRFPRIPAAPIFAFVAAAGLVLLAYRFSLEILDRPINAITIDGPFQRVSALQIEEAIGGELDSGFLSANLRRIRDHITELPWIDNVTVVRRWPDRLQIEVSEQIPAACWGENGLLNIRGELFMSEARHVPAELPRLRGPADRSADVAARYLSIRKQLIAAGMDLREVSLDARGAWQLKLQNGIEIRLGRRDVDARENLFLDVVADIVASKEADIRYVDMRYNNGFVIGWRNGGRIKLDPSDADDTPVMTAQRAE